MKIYNTKFKDLLLLKHEAFDDERGVFKELFRINELNDRLSYSVSFCQENVVESSINVLRGLHYQKFPYQQSKLITVISGAILDIAVDIREESKTYGKYYSRILKSENNESLFVPSGFAHGYLTLTKKALICYNVDNYYNSNYEGGIFFNDPKLNIKWGQKAKKMIISKKDLQLNNFKW